MILREQYVRLERHLRADGRPRIEMTFAEVARAIGEQLPDSAYRHPAWWGSDPKHTQAVWLDAGYLASPNLTAERVTFTKKHPETSLENLLTRTAREKHCACALLFPDPRKLIIGASRKAPQLQLSQIPVNGMTWWQVGQSCPSLPSPRSDVPAFDELRRLSTHVVHALSVFICASVAGTGVPRISPQPQSKWLQSGSCRIFGSSPVGVPSRCTG